MTDHERPAITDLTADVDTDNDKLELTWSEPTGITQLETRVTETFDSYNHGDMTFGDWRSEDKSFWGFDGVKTITVDGVKIDIPNSDDAQAFMVFDPAMAGIDLDDNPEWEPISGDKLIVSFGDAANDDMEANNDWLVSPELSGKKQTISFWARTAAKKGKPDEIRVYFTTAIEYNASGTVKTSSFTALDNASVVLTREWVKYEYELPDGTTHFAIRNLSDDGFAVLIDDITYEPYLNKINANFEGYNVYRDGVLLNQTPITETSYVVTPIVNGKYVVKVVYDEGESDKSNEVIVESSGISTVEIETPNNVYYDLNGIMVKEPQDGRIYIVNGRKVLYRKK
ncbi:MAG: choice-of-anchor J domain-containing protein [Muribaculaceae bacterium]|nr:choice-of-anchor J domain-containing protein [Muribaculaceae bacterium]